MAWYYGSKRIFVQEHQEVGSQIIPRLQPLTGATIYQWFGYESPKVTITCLVVGTIDKAALLGFYDDGTARTLTGPYSISGAYYLKDITITLTNATCQTLRPDLAEDSPVYNVKMELYEA